MYQNIQKAHPEMTFAECKQLMTKLLDEQMKPLFSEEQMIAIFNHMLFEQGKKLIKTDKISAHKFAEAENGDANGSYKPGFIEQFTPKQREERRKKSQAVRHAMIDIAEGLCINERELERTTGRSTQGVERQVFEVLTHPVDSTAPPEEQERVRTYNAEVIDLFGGSKFEANRQQRRDELMQRNPGMTPEQAGQALRARCAQIVMDRYHEFAVGIDNIEALIDSNLPAETLAANAKKLFRMQRAIVAIDNILGKIPEQFTLSEEDTKLLKMLQLSQNICAAAMGRARQIANPAFEYLDYSMMKDVDIAFYDMILDNEAEFPADEPWDRSAEERRPEAERNAPQQAAPNQEEQPEPPREPAEENQRLREGVPEQYMETLSDVINGNFVDEFRHIDEDYHIDTHRTVLESYGFTNVSEQQTHYMESDISNISDFTLLKSVNTIPVNTNLPFAVESHGRYGIFRQTPEGCQAVEPETLFNYQCSSKIHKLSDMMNAADPPNHHGKQAFHEMRLAFEIILQAANDHLFRLDDDPNHALPRNTITNHLNSLIANAQAYLNTKQASLTYIADRQANAQKHGRTYNLTTNETWDVRRTDMAKALINFATAKLEELSLIDSAHATMQQYVGLTPAQRLERIAEMDAEWLQERRNAEPIKWIQDKINSTYCNDAGLRNAIPDPLRTALKRAGNNLGNTSADNLSKRDALTYQALVGRMIAAEQIMQEDALMHGMPGGTLRDFYVKSAATDDYIKLGAYALKKHLGYSPEDVLISADLLGTISHFDPKQLATDTLEFSYHERRQSSLEMKLRGLYVSSIHQTFSNVLDVYDTAAVQFAQDNIQSFRIAEHLRPDNTISREDANKLLTDCIISSMIQQARQERGSAPGHSELEYMLQQYPEDIKQLRRQITESNSYEHAFDEYFNTDKTAITYENLVKIIDQKLPQMVAMAEYQDSVHLRNTLLFHRLVDVLQKNGLNNDHPQFRTLDGANLDPYNNPADLARVVKGEALRAISTNPQAEFICRSGLTPPQAANASAANAIRNAANMDHPTFSKAVGSPFDITPDKQLDLNTPEGIWYVLDGNPVILSGEKNLVLLRYDSKAGTVSRKVAPYRQIGDILNKIGFSHDMDALSFYMPNGTLINSDKLYDMNSPEYQHIISGRPFDVTSANGHQYRITFDRDKGTATYERTAHDELVSFFEGDTLKDLRASVDALKALNIPASPQYAKMVENLVTLDNMHAPFYKEQFLHPNSNAALTQAVNDLKNSADTFLKNEAYGDAQFHRAIVAQRISDVADNLRTILRRETGQRLTGKLSEVKIKRNINQIHTVSQTKGKPKLIYTVDLARREEIVAWLREYNNAAQNDAQAEQGNKIVNDGNPNAGDQAKKIPFNSNKYTADDLRKVRIDAKVLTDAAARTDFLNKETARQQDAKHVVANEDSSFTIMGQAARRKAITDWLREQNSVQNSVRSEFLEWLKTTMPVVAKSLEDADNNKVIERTNRYLQSFGLNPDMLDFHGVRAYYFDNLDAEKVRREYENRVKLEQENTEKRAKLERERTEKRENIIEWLSTIPNQKLDESDMFEDEDLNPNPVIENNQQYTKEDLIEVGIDPEVLDNPKQRAAFIAEERSAPSTMRAQENAGLSDEINMYREFNQKLGWFTELPDSIAALNALPLPDLSDYVEKVLRPNPELNAVPQPKLSDEEKKARQNLEKSRLNLKKSRLNLLAEQYSSHLAAMSSLSVDNIALLNTDLTTLRTEVRTLLTKYENTPSMTDLLKPIQDIKVFADTQLERLHAFDIYLHPAETLTDSQRVMAAAEYKRLKPVLMGEMEASIQALTDGYFRIHPIFKIALSDFDQMDSLTPNNIRKLYEFVDTLSSYYKGYQRFNGHLVTQIKLLDEANRFIYGVPAAPDRQPDSKISREAYLQRASALSAELPESAFVKAVQPVIDELKNPSNKLINLVQDAQVKIAPLNTEVEDTADLLTSFAADINNRALQPDDKALRTNYLNQFKTLADKMPEAVVNGISLRSLMQNVVKELEKPLDEKVADKQHPIDAKLTTLRGLTLDVQHALNTYAAQGKTFKMLLDKLAADENYRVAENQHEAKEPLKEKAPQQNPDNLKPAQLRAHGIQRFNDLITLSNQFKTDEWRKIIADINNAAPMSIDRSGNASLYRTAANALSGYVKYAEPLQTPLEMVRDGSICQNLCNNLATLQDNIYPYMQRQHSHLNRINAMNAAMTLIDENNRVLREMQDVSNDLRNWLETNNFSPDETAQLYQDALNHVQIEVPVQPIAEQVQKDNVIANNNNIINEDAPANDEKVLDPLIHNQNKSKAEQLKTESKAEQNYINIINENVIHEANDDKKIISDQEFDDKLKSGTLTSNEFKNYYLAQTQNLLKELSKFNSNDHWFAGIHRDETSAAEKLSQGLRNSKNAEQVIAAMDTFMYSCTALGSFIDNSFPDLRCFRKFHKRTVAVLPLAKTPVLSNYAAALNPDDTTFKRLLNGPMMTLEATKKLYQNKANSLADKLQKKAGDADAFEKRFAEQLNDVFVKNFDVPTDQLIAKLEEFMNQPGADILGHKELEAFTNEIKQTLLPNLRGIHATEANPIPHPSDSKLSFAEYAKRTRKQLEAMINNTSMAENDMDTLKPALEQFRDALPADGENATVYDKDVLIKNVHSLRSTIRKLSEREQCTFPKYVAFCDKQQSYLSYPRITKDKWENHIEQNQDKAPIRSTWKMSPDEKALYDKADWLNRIVLEPYNTTTQALNEELAELLSGDRFHEICIEKKDEKSNQQLQKSQKMRNLALCVTLKTLLIDEQVTMNDSGYIQQLTKVLTLDKLKKLLDCDKSFDAAYKKLDNKGLYNFIAHDEYREWSKQIVPGIYTAMDKLGKKYNIPLQGTQRNRENSMSKSGKIENIKHNKTNAINKP